jgi:hypothetical protein
VNDALAAQAAGLDPRILTGIAPASIDLDAPDRPSTLPTDHPVWQRDVLSISSRTRALLGALKPVAVKVIAFWDHAVRTLRLAGGTLTIDPSGCYRMRP